MSNMDLIAYLQRLNCAEEADASPTPHTPPTVYIGGQTMTAAQFHAARYPLLHPNDGEGH